MNSSIVLKAQKFCSEHFCDNTLGMDDYMSLIDSYLDEYASPEEKVQFLVEVKRIGSLIIADSLSQISAVEHYDLNQRSELTFEGILPCL